MNTLQQNFAYTNTGVERAASSLGNLIDQSFATRRPRTEDTQRIVDVHKQPQGKTARIQLGGQQAQRADWFRQSSG